MARFLPDTDTTATVALRLLLAANVLFAVSFLAVAITATHARADVRGAPQASPFTESVIGR